MIQVSAASDNAGGSGVDPNAYDYCRSQDTTGGAGCQSNLTVTGTTSYVVSGADRPAPGKRRAYFVRARDEAGLWGAWNSPLYVETISP